MANFVVTNLNDSGAGSLRAAVALANANADADVITFALAGTVTLTSGELALTNDVTIDGDINGDNKADVTISGNNASRILHQTGATTDVTLLSLALSNGNADRGGAIYANAGTLAISDSTIGNNHAANGGGIDTFGTSLTITTSLLQNNSASASGGGLYSDGSGTTTITNTTIYGNTADYNGGGIYVDNSNTLNLNNSTVTHNASDFNGDAVGSGGGIYRFSSAASVNILNSVVADNLKGTGAALNDVYGTIDTSSHSVFKATVSITNDTLSQLNVANVGLGSLGDHGGTVLTQNINAGSVLINTGINSSLPATDANGGNRVVLGTVDVGATEFALVVTTASDTILNDGLLSLREAVALADANAGADVITFDASLAGSTLAMGIQLVLSSDITIDGDVNGDNRADITLSGNNLTRILLQTGAATDVHLLSLTLSDGTGNTGNGGAMYASGGTLDIRDTTFTNNSSNLRGGGLMVNSVVTTISDSLFVTNTAQNGGGIYALGGTTTTISNSTFHANAATVSGGGMYIDGNATITNSTITENHADSDVNGTGAGGGIFKYVDVGETLNLQNTVLSFNSVGSVASLNDVNSGAAAQIQSTTSAFTTAADVTAIGTNLFNLSFLDTGLQVLANNGGTVDTQALAANSLLIGAGNNASAANLTTDANGNQRIAGNHVDIGAVEAQLVVTNTNDSGAGSLRQAIADANSSSAHDVITFDASLSGQTITLLSQLSINTDITIDGDSNHDNKADITISGGDTTRILSILGSFTDVDLLNLNLTHGHSNYGGAIKSLASTLHVVNSTISYNSASAKGGGIFTQSGNTVLMNTLVIGNSANDGGGLNSFHFDSTSSTTLVNSSLINNSSTGHGGGISVDGNLTVLNSTITGNQANSDSLGGGTGGGIYKSLDVSESVTILNTVLADNHSLGGTIANDISTNPIAQFHVSNSAFSTAVTVTNKGGNLFSQTAAQLNLGELLDNGGATLTRSMLDGSVLINAGSNAALTPDILDIDGDGNVAELIPLDGRGGPRQTGVVDIGAVELVLNETIHGTAANNFISGGLGVDDLSGLGGDDVISGGVGADHIDGGTGNNTADYRTSTGTNVSVNLLLDTASGGHATGDTLDNIQNLFGSLLQRDILIGDDGSNVLYGFGGMDSLVGGIGDDFIEGGAGADAINGGAGVGDTASYRDSTVGQVDINLLTNTYSGGDAAGDTLFFIENLEGSLTKRDILIGNIVANRIFGNGGVDSIQGQDGNDFIDGGTGGDSLNAGAGIDTVSYEKSSAGVTINLNVALQMSAGDANGDSLFFFENVNGSDFVDNITGNLFLNRLVGGNGADTLNGGTGSDYLTGGGNADTFRFSDFTFGSDSILDWQDGVDHISIAPILETSFAGLTFSGNGTTDVIVKGFNGSGSAIIVHANAAFTLDAGDFLFV